MGQDHLPGMALSSGQAHSAALKAWHLCDELVPVTPSLALARTQATTDTWEHVLDTILQTDSSRQSSALKMEAFHWGERKLTHPL